MRLGWKKTVEEKDNLGSVWTHEATGWYVQRCTHMTAIYPYLVVDPDGCAVVAPSGYAFPKLEWAMNAVEGILAGTHVAVFVAVQPEGPRRLRKKEDVHARA